MVVIPVRVQPEAYSLTRNKNGSIRRPLQTTRLWNRRTNGRRRQGCIARQSLYQPVGHRVARMNIKWKGTWLGHQEHYRNLNRGRSDQFENNLQDWKIEEIDGWETIFFKGKNYIPKDLELQQDIVKMYHDHKMAEHPGELETYNGIRQNYWWPGLRTFVKNYIQGCGICQQFKINRSLSNPAYIAIEGANNTRAFAKCSLDLITDLPPVEGYNSILVLVDWGLSKGVILCPCAETITWEGTVTLLRDNLFKRFGLLDKIISDRDPRFAAHTFQKPLKLLNIKSNLTTAYHPQSDGATEGVNQEIEAYLSIYCTSHPEDWLHSLSTLEFTHTIEDTLNKFTLHLNWYEAITRSPFPSHSLTQNFWQSRKRWTVTGKKL
jgi:hypothetical protein